MSRSTLLSLTHIQSEEITGLYHQNSVDIRIDSRVELDHKLNCIISFQSFQPRGPSKQATTAPRPGGKGRRGPKVTAPGTLSLEVR